MNKGILGKKCEQDEPTILEYQEEIPNQADEPINYDAIPYQVGDNVRVQILITEKDGPESFCYLKMWEKKRGLVVGLYRNPLCNIKFYLERKKPFYITMRLVYSRNIIFRAGYR